MNEETIDSAARVFATPDESGIFEREPDSDIIRGFKGFAEIHTVEQPDGWRAAAFLDLPDGNPIGALPSIHDAPYPTRGLAVADACEQLIGWCSTGKEQGTKKHRTAAEKVQTWAMELAKRELIAEVPVDASREEISEADYEDGEPGADGSLGDAAKALVQQIAPGDKPEKTIPAVQWRPIEELHESPLNPRKQYLGIEELAARMRQSGFDVMKPIIGRLQPAGGDEVAAGHRRLRAARMAGLTHVPCIIYEMSEAEFMDRLNFDNGGGEDVHPLEEAAGWQNLIDNDGWTAAQIAARIGQSERYVFDHLKCLDLIDAGQELFLDGHIKLAHAREIARLEPAEQRAALEYCCPAYDPDRVVTTRELASWIEGRRKAREEEARIAQSPLFTEPVAQPEAEPEPAPAPVAEEPAAPAVEIPAGPSLNQVVDSERDADRALRKSEKDRKDWEAQQRAIDEKAREEKAADEAKRMVRAKLIYRRTVETICAKANFPASLEATREMCMVVIESLDGGDPCDLAADMYRIPKKGGSVRQRDIEAALYRLPPATLVRVTLAAMLLDIGDKLQWADNTMVISLASDYKVDRVKVAREIDAELNPKPAAPAKDRKAAISKLGTLNTPAPKKSAPAAKKAAAPAKKAAARKGKGKK